MYHRLSVLGNVKFSTSKNLLDKTTRPQLQVVEKGLILSTFWTLRNFVRNSNQDSIYDLSTTPWAILFVHTSNFRKPLFPPSLATTLRAQIMAHVTIYNSWLPSCISGPLNVSYWNFTLETMKPKYGPYTISRSIYPLINTSYT